MSKQKEFGRSRPSVAYELEYRRKLQEINAEMQKDIQREVLAYLEQKRAQDAFKDWREFFKTLRLTYYRKYEEIGRILSEELVRKTDARTRAQIRRKLKEIGWTISPIMNEPDKDILREIIKNNVALIKSIPQQYIRRVQQVTMKAVAIGGDKQKLTSMIKRVGEMSDNRAAMIARDQINKATQTLAVVNAQKFGATKGRWIHIPGKYSYRITHKEMNGKVFELAKGMYDKEVGKYVKPGELYACNCQFAVLLPGFDT